MILRRGREDQKKADRLRKSARDTYARRVGDRGVPSRTRISSSPSSSLRFAFIIRMRGTSEAPGEGRGDGTYR
jgi:hypothetical protein